MRLTIIHARVEIYTPSAAAYCRLALSMEHIPLFAHSAARYTLTDLIFSDCCCILVHKGVPTPDQYIYARS